MLGQRIGYRRVSTLDQHADRQLEGIEVDKTFLDHASGKDTTRPQLALLLSFVRAGDTVIVHSMDRLARNLDDLRRIVHTLTGRGVRIEFVKEHLAFTGEDSPMASLMLSVMGAFAEFERALIHERQREGIALAKQRGAYKGRKKSLSQASVKRRSLGSLGLVGKHSTNTCEGVRVRRKHGEPIAQPPRTCYRHGDTTRASAGTLSPPPSFPRR
jgi:DNA invertase Pin-like site-specific DNA recombinase